MSYVLLYGLPIFIALLFFSTWCYWRSAKPDFRWRVPALLIGAIIPIYLTVISNSGITFLFSAAGLALAWRAGKLSSDPTKKIRTRVVVVVSTILIFIAALAVAFS